jgi:hypothetical protein
MQRWCGSSLRSPGPCERVSARLVMGLTVLRSLFASFGLCVWQACSQWGMRVRRCGGSLAALLVLLMSVVCGSAVSKCLHAFRWAAHCCFLCPQLAKCLAMLFCACGMLFCLMHCLCLHTVLVCIMRSHALLHRLRLGTARRSPRYGGTAMLSIAVRCCGLRRLNGRGLVVR